MHPRTSKQPKTPCYHVAMAYTSADLTNVQTAITNLAIGKRVSELRIAGKTIAFSEVTLANLQALESTIKSSLGTTSLRSYAKNGGRGYE